MEVGWRACANLPEKRQEGIAVWCEGSSGAQEKTGRKASYHVKWQIFVHKFKEKQGKKNAGVNKL